MHIRDLTGSWCRCFMLRVMCWQLGSEHPVFCLGLCLGAQTGLHYKSKTYVWGEGRWIRQQIWCESHRSRWRPGWALDCISLKSGRLGILPWRIKSPPHPKLALGHHSHEFLLFTVQLAQVRADPGFCFKETVGDGLSAGRYRQHNDGNSDHSVRWSDWLIVNDPYNMPNLPYSKCLGFFKFWNNP